MREGCPTVTDGTLTIGTDNPAYPPWFGGSRRRAKVEDQRPVQRQGLRVRRRLRGREAARLRAREGEVGLHAVQQVVRAGQEGVRLRHQPDLVHARARQGRRLQQLVLRRQPGDRRPEGHEDRRGALDRGPARLQVRRPDRDDELPARSSTRSSRRRSRRSTTRTTRPSSHSRPSRSTRSSSTCRPRSTSPRCRCRTAKILGQFPRTPGGEHFGMVFQKGNPLAGCVNKALATLKGTAR